MSYLVSAYPNATYITAMSDSPTGPFALHKLGASVRNKGGGDFTIFVDHDQQAYIIYDAWSNGHRVSVEKLTTDYLDSTGTGTGPLSPKGNEAPMVFYRQGFFYMLWGPTCCFCHQGSGASVSVAKAMLGPWNDTLVDINPKSWALGARTIKAQNNYVSLGRHKELICCFRCSR